MNLSQIEKQINIFEKKRDSAKERKEKAVKKWDDEIKEFEDNYKSYDLMIENRHLFAHSGENQGYDLNTIISLDKLRKKVIAMNKKNEELKKEFNQLLSKQETEQNYQSNTEGETECF